MDWILYKFMTQSLSRNYSEVNTLGSLLVPAAPALEPNPSRKRLFVRKPAISTTITSSERKRKPSTEAIMQKHIPVNSQDKIIQRLKFGKDTEGAIRMQRHTEIFTKEQVANAALSFTKQVFFTPRGSRRDNNGAVRYFQKTSDLSDAYDTDHTNEPTTDLRLNPKINLDQTTDQSSCTHANRNSEALSKTATAEKYKNLQVDQKEKKNEEGIGYFQLQNRQDEGRCVYCINFKKINEILQEKCSKLQQQLQHRSQNIRQLSEKIDQLKKQNNSLTATAEKFQQVIYEKQMKVYQECALRFETARKQFSRMCERIKYLQIQNGMLLRYKDQFGLVTQEYEHIRFQNDNLKRQINTISRMGQNINKKKQFNKPETPYNMEKKPSNIGKYMLFKPMGQDDAISLQLSDRSFDQF